MISEMEYDLHFPIIDRVDGRTPKECPRTKEEFEAMESWSREQLEEYGLLNWDGQTFLFPQEWHKDLPLGIMIVTIFKRVKSPLTKKKLRDNEARYGALSYGILTKNERIEKGGVV